MSFYFLKTVFSIVEINSIIMIIKVILWIKVMIINNKYDNDYDNNVIRN